MSHRPGLTLPTTRAGRLAASTRIWEPAVVVVAALYAVAFAWPASVQPNAWVWGSHGDGLGNIVEFSWFVQAIQHGVSWNVDPNLGLPFGENFGGQPHEPLYFWAQIGIGLVAGSVVALNLLSLIALPITAWVTYRLTLWLTHSPVAAFVAGIGFGCCFYIIANTGGEPTLAQLWVFPAVVLAVLKLLERPSLPTILVAGGVVAMSAMVNFYYVLFVALSAVVLGAVWILTTWIRNRAFPLRSTVAGLAAGALALIATIAVYELAVGNLAQRASRIHRTTATLAALAANPVDFFLPPSTNPWLGGPRQRIFELRLLQHPGIFTDFSELSIALPILLLAAAGVLIMVAPRWKAARPAASGAASVYAILGVAVLGLWLLVPPIGHRFHLTFLSLEGDIQALAPQYGSFYRAGLLVVFAASVLAGIAVAALAIRRPRAAIAVALIAVAGTLGENFTWPADRVLAVQSPPEYVWVSQHPGDYAIADYPLLAAGSGANEYTVEFYQRFHGHPLVNGSIGGSDSESMREELRNPNNPGVAGVLAALGVRYVIWHPDVIRQYAPLSPSYAALLPSFEPHTSDYQPVMTFSDAATIFNVTATPVPEFAFYASGFGPVVPPDRSDWIRATTGPDGRIGVYVGSAQTAAVTVSFTCSSASAATLHTSAGEWAIEPGTNIAISIPMAVHAGVNELDVRFAPDAAASAGGIGCTPITVTS